MQEKSKNQELRIIRKPVLLDMLSVSDCTVWRWEKAGLFPRRLNLGANTVGWIEAEVLEWLANRPRASDR